MAMLKRMILGVLLFLLSLYKFSAVTSAYDFDSRPPDGQKEESPDEKRAREELDKKYKRLRDAYYNLKIIVDALSDSDPNKEKMRDSLSDLQRLMEDSIKEMGGRNKRDDGPC